MLIPSHDDNKTEILGRCSTLQGEGTSELGTTIEVCVKRGGFSIKIFIRTIEDDGDDETMSDKDNLVTGELTIPYVTAELVGEDIGEVE